MDKELEMAERPNMWKSLFAICHPVREPDQSLRKICKHCCKAVINVTVGDETFWAGP